MSRQSTNTEPPLKFSYLFNPEESMQDLISNFIKDNSGKQWEIEPFGGSSSDRKLHYCLYLSNSPFTTQRDKQTKLQVLDNINPSYYFYIPCVVQK